MSNNQDGKIGNLDGVVTGTPGDDTMLPGYTDQNGDQIDGQDGLNDTILALAGDDTVNAGLGDDEVYGGSGADAITGSSGNDTIYGDSSGLGNGGTVREAFKWSEAPDPDGADPVDGGDDLSGGFTQNTGSVNVTFEVVSQTSDSRSEFAENEQLVADTEAAPDSSLFSDHDGADGRTEYALTFDEPVENVEFRINDIDNDSSITILAFDAQGNAIPVTLDAGTKLDLLDTDGINGDDTAQSQGGNGLDTSPQYSVLVEIPGPVARIEIVHEQNGSVDSGVNVTDIYFDAPLTDGGTGGDDTLFGGDGDDVIFGEEGSDTLTGGDGADTLSGGDDEDTFVGGTAGDVIDGGDGGTDKDTLDLRGQGEVSVIYTTPDEESGYVFLDEFGEYVEFTEIEEILVDGLRDPDGIVEGTLDGDVIDDLYDGDPDGDFVDNGDNIFPGGDPDSDIIVGKSGDDTIIAGADRDLILADGGNDNVDGGAGDDTACGGEGDDYLDGADGDDVLMGKAGFDTVIGGEGADFLSGGLDDDQVVGGEGDDTLEGNEGADLVDGGTGDDVLDGGEGDDTLDAGGGNDTVEGGAGNDNITGNPGDDVLSGGDGDDTIQGNDGTDIIDGGAGADLISTGPGEDSVTAGDDRDTIIVVGQDSQFVDGSEGGDDFDTLEVRGNAEVEFDPSNSENGVVYFLDENDVRTGVTTTFVNIENVVIVDQSQLDGVVEGDDNANLIDENYTGDPEGDVIDNFDALENFVDQPGDSTVPSSFFEFPGGTPRGDNRDAVEAGGGDDTVLSGDGDDIVSGGTGNDSIDGGIGFDDLSGDEGDDTILGGIGNDKLFGGTGNDVLSGGAQADTLIGNEGNDLLAGGDDADLLLGNEGNDTILGGAGGDTIDGGDGDDTILGGLGDDIISTGDGANFVNAGLGNNEVIAGAGNDTLIGSVGNDSLIAGGGDDVVEGGGGDDTLIGGAGQDEISGGAGDDRISGGTPGVTGTAAIGLTPDTLTGGDGDDLIDGSSGDDSISGGAGNDLLAGGSGGDTIDGGDGDDLIFLGGELDILTGDVTLEEDSADLRAANAIEDGINVGRGGNGADTIIGSENDDSIDGGQGADLILGLGGQDTLNGQQDADNIDGGEGDDLIDGGVGADLIVGGTGADTIIGGVGGDNLSGGDDEDVFIVGSADDGNGDNVSGGDGGTDFDSLDLSGVGSQGVDWRLTDVVTDSDGNGIDGTVEFLDGSGNVTGNLVFSNIENVICFTPGTLIATPMGERLVESLREGDRVITRDNGIQEIRWAGQRVLSGADLSHAPHLRPVLIRAGSLGNGLPERDMMLSPNHRVLVANDRTSLYFEEREVLVAAKHLTGLDGVDEVDASGVTYVHFMFDRHEVVLSDGAWTESFQPGDYSLQGLGNAQRSEIFELFPELKTQEGLRTYHAARRSLKRHEAEVLFG